MSLDQQSGYTKFPFFICQQRQKTALHQEWPLRKTFDPGLKNIERVSRIDPKNMLLPPLHTKLGLMKQFVKALRTSGGMLQILLCPVQWFIRSKSEGKYICRTGHKKTDERWYFCVKNWKKWKKSLKVLLLTFLEIREIQTDLFMKKYKKLRDFLGYNISKVYF